MIEHLLIIWVYPHWTDGPGNICTNPQWMLMLRMTLILTLEEDWISAPTCELLRSESSLSLKRWRNEIEMKVKVKTCFLICIFKSKVQTGFVSFLKWPLDQVNWPSFCILVALRPSLPSKGIAICNLERRLGTFIANYTKSTRWMSILVRTGLSKNNVSFSLKVQTLPVTDTFIALRYSIPHSVFFCISLVFWL